MDETVLSLVEALAQIEQDSSVPKNVRLKLQNAMAALQDGDLDIKLKANKAIQELDDISEDPNIPSFVRPQIWNVVSMLEGL